MAIPETQLDTWSKQGSVTQSQATYATIKNVLEDKAAPFANRSYTSFLQGSYGNDTNIYADSDVDVVMRLDSTFYYDLTRLDDSGKANFEKAHGAAPYGLADFKKEISAWLTHKFGSAVKPGTKAIFVQGSGNRRDADVLPAAVFRRYYKFGNMSDQSSAEGICFFTSDGSRIENFPKQHSDNCTAKHKATKQFFKPMVRILKNMRNRMVQDGMIEEGLAPSYYLEGLLYNVLNDKFGGNYADTFTNSINWILTADRTKFLCANEQFYLLREDSPVTWRTAKCDKFLNAAVQLWNSW